MRFSLIVIIFVSFNFGFSQNQGFPFIQNYSYKEYKAGNQNWAFCQDLNGNIYVGNQSGVLIYDGFSWKKIIVSNSSAVRSLDVFNDVVYIGAKEEFGYLEPNTLGLYEYKSLLNLVPDQYKAFKDVWKTHCTENKVYFQTFDAVFLYEKGEIIPIISDSSSFHLSFKVANEIYITERGVGLKRIVGDKLISFHATTKFADLKTYGMAEHPKGILTVTSEKGLFLITNDGVIKFENEIDAYLTENKAYNLIRQSDGNYAFATLSGGVVIMDSKGKLIRIVDAGTGLLDQNVKTLYNDKFNNLWTGLNNGIAKIEAQSGITFYDEKSGIKGSIESIKTFNNTVLVASSEGLFIKKDELSKFDQVITSSCWDIVISNKLSIAVIASTNGIYMIDTLGNATKINDNYAFSVCLGAADENSFWAGLYEGVIKFSFNGKWVFENKLANVSETVKAIENINNELWMGVPLLGYIKYNLATNSRAVYDTSRGIPNVLFNQVFIVDGKMIAGTVKGLYQRNKEKDIFEPYDKLGKKFSEGDLQVYCLEQYSKNELWFKSTGNKYGSAGSININDDSISYFSSPFERFLDDDIFCIHPTKKEVWFGGAEGLYRYDRSISKNYDIPYQATINKTKIGEDSVVFYGNYRVPIVSGKDTLWKMTTVQNRAFNFDYKYNDISFEFAAAFFDKEKEMQFNWFLEGNDERWSGWNTEHKHHYTNLREGDYTFKIKARNIYGFESEESSFVFTILPPWYRTVWAYLMYIICGVGLVYIIIQLSLRRLKQQKKLLEKIVQERTKEIQHQKEEIEEQHEALEESHKEISDSIFYAEGIQQSILPSQNKIIQYFPSSFVLFQPKDVVSGDFYWMDHKNGVSYFTAADCTGHGVPGAFVSMVGLNGLHRAVNEYELVTPAEILDRLAHIVEDTFEQRKDGMDIALCSIYDSDLIFAGANNPLWVVRNSSTPFVVNGDPIEPNINEENLFLYEVKADKQPVGKFDERLPFTNQKIKLEQGDKIYVFSDGFPDQFGGEKGKKFMSKKLKLTLISIYKQSMQEQHDFLIQTMKNWIKEGNTEQIDDICIFGVEVL